MGWLLFALGCQASPLHVPISGLEGDWLVVFTTDPEGAVVEVEGAFDLRAPFSVSLEPPSDHEVWLLSFEASDLPFDPVGPIRAQLGSPPSAPSFDLLSDPPQVLMSWPEGAQLRVLESDGVLAPASLPAAREELRIDYAYEPDRPVHLRDFASTSAYLADLEPILQTLGATTGFGSVIGDVRVVNSTRVVALKDQVVVVFERGQDEEPLAFSEEGPNRWFPVRKLPGGADGDFVSMALAPESRADGSRSLWVVGKDAARVGRIWAFRLEATGLVFEAELPVRGTAVVPKLTQVEVDMEGTVVVAGPSNFVATKTRTATVFESSGALQTFVRSLAPLAQVTPELTMLAISRRLEAPHVVGLGIGWLIEGDAVTGAWRRTEDLREVSGRSANNHPESFAESEDGSAWVAARFGGFFSRRPGERFEVQPLRAGSALRFCATPDLQIEQQLFGLELSPTRAFLVSEHCTAALRVRLVDTFVTPVLPEGASVAEVTVDGIRHRSAHAADGIYVVAGYDGRVMFVEMD